MLETKRVSVLEIFYDFVFVTGLFTLLYMLADITKYPLETNLIWRFALTLSVILYVWFSQAAYNNRYLKEGPLDYVCHFFDMTVFLFLFKGNTASWKDSWVLLSACLAFLSLSLALRYGLQWLKAQDDQNKYFAASHALIFLAQGVLLLLGTKLSYEWGVAALVVAILAGWLAPFYFLRDRQVPALDFDRLKDRTSLMTMMYSAGLVVLSLGTFLSLETTTLLGLILISCLILHYKVQIDRVPQGADQSAAGFIYSHYVIMIGLSLVIIALGGFMTPYVRISHIVDLSYAGLAVYYLGILLLSFKRKPEFLGGFATWKIYLPLLVGWILSLRSPATDDVELVRLVVVVGLIFAGQVYLLKKPEQELAPVLEGAPAEGNQGQTLEAAEETPVTEVAEEVALEIEPAESEVATTEVPAAQTPESQDQAQEESNPQAESPAPSQD
ncbi:low temperature requirement protein A [uncultured Abiotrophia sp.]|uniref:low temperature requirement protein A n=1 Tax=uncultured Abiotrophia sp. TaxID=316094 RepID=UPI00288B4416|nr:low temperature requirement protein A [uncultured Abiotrophia sp.]